MYNRGYTVILLLLLFALPFTASGSSFLQDTTKVKRGSLDSVIVKAGVLGRPTNRAFAVGTKIQSASAQTLESMKSNTLSDYIREQSSIYIKEYGKGMRSYISIRGTSSSHTSVAWNGMSLAVPTLGQTDLSHIPLYFFDKLDVHTGGSSLLYGDGSIGGSLQLSTNPKWIKGVTGDVTLLGGGFATLFTGATVRYSNGSLESRSGVFRSSAENNYSFLNNTKPGTPKEYLNNSAYSNYGALQEVFKKLKDSSLISFNIMYLNFFREIQPSVSLNDRPESYASIADRNLRSSLAYNSPAKGWFSYSGSVAFSNDYEKYKDDIIAASRVKVVAEGQLLNDDLLIKAGVSGEFTSPSVDSYRGAADEQRYYAFAMARVKPVRVVTLSLGVRAGKVTGSDVPLMPSAGFNLSLINRGSHYLFLRGSISRNSKVPSLNDRYWGGVHSYLKSEKSLNREVGADYQMSLGLLTVTSFVTLYRSDVDNWIRWLPAGQVWRPQNIPEVDSKGVEGGATAWVKLAETSLNLTVNYSYTDIKMVKGLWLEDPSTGRQLAYQPKHSLRATFKAKHKHNELFTSISYTGERTTLDIFDILPWYTIADVGINRDFAIGGNKLSAAISLKNITNVRYQNVKFYAMPGRSWQITLRYNF